MSASRCGWETKKEKKRNIRPNAKFTYKLCIMPDQSVHISMCKCHKRKNINTFVYILIIYQMLYLLNIANYLTVLIMCMYIPYKIVCVFIY